MKSHRAPRRHTNVWDAIYLWRYHDCFIIHTHWADDMTSEVSSHWSIFVRWFATEFSYSVISWTFSWSPASSAFESPSSIPLFSGLCWGEASGEPTLSGERVARGVSCVHTLHLEYRVEQRDSLVNVTLGVTISIKSTICIPPQHTHSSDVASFDLSGTKPPLFPSRWIKVANFHLCIAKSSIFSKHTLAHAFRFFLHIHSTFTANTFNLIKMLHQRLHIYTVWSWLVQTKEI